MGWQRPVRAQPALGWQGPVLERRVALGWQRRVALGWLRPLEVRQGVVLGRAGALGLGWWQRSVAVG